MGQVTEEQLESLLDSAIRAICLRLHPLAQWLCHSEYLELFVQSALLAQPVQVRTLDPALSAKILMIHGFLAGYEMRRQECGIRELEAMFQEKS